MKICAHRQPRAFALFIVLISIVALGVLVAAFATRMKTEMKLASNSYNETQLEWVGRSGVEAARYSLAIDMVTPGPGQRIDYKGSTWAGGTDNTNSTPPPNPLVCDQGTAAWSIVDNDRKFNINTLAFDQAMMNRILTQIGTDASEIPGVIASIQDWIDPDDEVREGGAESAYYQGLPHPYNAKNAPLDDIAELLLIKGVTPDMFYGAAATNHSQAYLGANSPAANNSSLRPNAPIVASGLKDIFTTASSGKLNINFATRDELMMLPLVDASIADQILERTQNENLSTTGNFAWSSPTELLASTSLGNQGAGLVANYCTFRSSIFTITVDVHVGQSQRTYYAIVQRNSPRDIPIISFWWK